MTDKKEIIIDGVDVSQCVYRMKDEYNRYCCTSTKENEGEERITAYYGCKYNHNCHYKQLKRKEQELQQAMDNYVQLDLQRVKEYNKLVDLYKAKEQEYEELNEYSVGFARKCQKLELDVCHLKDKNYNLQRRLDQLKQTLTEIKEIAEKILITLVGKHTLDN